jgi:hypothetical protein
MSPQNGGLAMLIGVDGIELLPPVTELIDLSDRITELFSKAKTVRAAIAFWTIPPDVLEEITGNRGTSILSAPGSFLCVDIQRPTNIDALAGLVKKGAAVYLNIRRLDNVPGRMLTSETQALLHTKIILVDKPENHAEFWIGSHNWTAPALFGPNTEASISLNMSSRAPLYLAAAHILTEIRDKYCRPFDIARVDYYKRLQQLFERGKVLRTIIELEGDDVADLGNQIICIFGTERQDFEAVSRVGSEVFLAIYDSTSRRKYLYLGEIFQTGLLAGANLEFRGTRFTQRRYAFTERKTFPCLKKAEEPNRDVLDRAYFFANIAITKFLTTSYSMRDPDEKGRANLWVESQSDPVTERMSLRFSQLYKQKRGLSSIISVPYDDVRAKSGIVAQEAMDYSEVPLEEKRTLADYRLIRKRVLEY